MADTTFVPGTVITSDWLNDINDRVYSFSSTTGNVGSYGLVDDPTLALDQTVALQAVIDLNIPLDFGKFTIKHTGVTATTAGDLFWSGDGASLHYTGVGCGVRVTTAASTDAAFITIRGVEFHGGANVLYVRGDATTKAILSDVSILNCRFFGVDQLTPSGTFPDGYATLTVSYADRVTIQNNYVTESYDNGIYTPFCRQVVVSGNFVHNCKGSAGIVCGYADEVLSPARYGDDIKIDGNIIWNDDDAPISVSTSYVRGIEVVFARGYAITNNIITNRQTSITNDYSIRNGIVVEEYTSLDGLISGNHISNIKTSGMEIGFESITPSEIRRLKIKGNYLYNIQQTGVKLDRCYESVEIDSNVFDTIFQSGISVGETCSADTLITNNTFSHIGIQTDTAAYQGVVVKGINTVVEGNTFNLGHVWIHVTSSATTPKVRVQSSNKTIYLQESGADVASVSFANKTFGELAEWIRLRAGWDATIYKETSAAYSAGTAEYRPGRVVTSGGLRYRCIAINGTGTTVQAPTNTDYWIAMSEDGKTPCDPYLRRTGDRISADQDNYVVPAAGLFLTSYEAELAIYFAYPTKGHCVARNNVLNTMALTLGTEGFYPNGGGGTPYLWEKPDTIADVLESGGGRTFYGSSLNSITTPTQLPALEYYITGDRFYPPSSATALGGWVCTASGLGSASTWKTIMPIPRLAFKSFNPGNLVDGAGETTTLTLSGVATTTFYHFIIRTNINLQGITLNAWVSAADTISVRYQNETGGAIDLVEHTLEVYVYTEIPGLG